MGAVTVVVGETRLVADDLDLHDLLRPSGAQQVGMGGDTGVDDGDTDARA